MPKILERRIALYAQTADILFPSYGQTPLEIASDIINEIGITLLS